MELKSREYDVIKAQYELLFTSFQEEKKEWKDKQSQLLARISELERKLDFFHSKLLGDAVPSQCLSLF